MEKKAAAAKEDIIFLCSVSSAGQVRKITPVHNSKLVLLYVLGPDAFLPPHVRRRHRDPQCVQEKQRKPSSPSERDGRSGQLLADEGDPAE